MVLPRKDGLYRFPYIHLTGWTVYISRQSRIGISPGTGVLKHLGIITILYPLQSSHV